MPFSIMNKLLYSDVPVIRDHYACPNNVNDVKMGFRYLERSPGQSISREASENNFVFFILEGRANVNCMTYPTKPAHSNEMFLITSNSFFKVEFTEYTKFVVLSFDKWNFHCSAIDPETFKGLRSDINCEMNIIEINHELHLFLDMVCLYLRSDQNCYHFQKIKTDEFFLLMRTFYTKEKLMHFLWPLIGDALDFRMFCFQAVGTVKDVGEMIARSGMSRSAFYDKFKQEFGDISPKKWLSNYNNRRILYLASMPNVTVKGLMYKMGFESESAFTQYCKRHFGDTPSNIIRTRGKNLEEA